MTRQVYKDIEYSLRRSDRKTASIYIERNGEVSLFVPKKLKKRQVEDVIESKRVWIYKGLADWEDLNANRIHREFVNGEGFLYLGRTYRLKIVKEQNEPLILKEGYFCLRKNDVMNASKVFKEFYREKGLPKVKERVEIYSKKIGIEPNIIRIKELKHRWASCSANGNLNFHWKAVMAPLTILDYIIVHELIHLIHPTHNEAFWNAVDKVLPDYERRKSWLKVNGAGMEI